VAGLVLALLTTLWLVLLGAAMIAAAWGYTGGASPYGYRGLGEVSVFVFFGLVAVLGTTYVQLERLTWPALLGGVACGALACAILVTNNLRDIPTDTGAGKRTLAVQLGDRRTRSCSRPPCGGASPSRCCWCRPRPGRCWPCCPPAGRRAASAGCAAG
jgi:1,4-dihydroxy-2-naphthoate octaprenyltransferase